MDKKTKNCLLKAVSIAENLLRPLGLRLTKKVAGHAFHYNPATDIGFTLLTTGIFEGPVLAKCSDFIRPDSVVLDVGANIGLHTVHFAACCPFGSVISLEPGRSTFAYLLRNVEEHSNVVPLNLALSAVAGLRIFYAASDDAYSGLKDTKRKPILREEWVACFTGDEILTPLLQSKRLDLIKIDVEGEEMQVLQGLVETITKHRPTILCEIVGGTHSDHPEAIVKFCVSLGYDAYVLCDSQLIAAGAHDDALYNYFFLPRNSAAV
jgi:FkbM family methyltransferase